MLPQGMFSVAVATVLFPALARLAARGDLDGFRATVSTGLRQIGFLLIPASVVSAVLAEPIVRLVYERGTFTACRRHRRRRLPCRVLTRARLQRLDADADARFYGLQANWLPTGIASGRSRSTPCSTPSLPGRRLGSAARDLARQHGRRRPADRVPAEARRARRYGARRRRCRPGDDRLRRLGAAAYALWYGLDQALGRSLGAQIASLGVALAVGTAVYLAACRALRVRELSALRSSIAG